MVRSLSYYLNFLLEQLAALRKASATTWYCLEVFSTAEFSGHSSQTLSAVDPAKGIIQHPQERSSLRPPSL